MIHDIFIPCRVGNYYLHTKRVLSIDFTSVSVVGLVLVYSGNKITLASSLEVVIKDESSQSQVSALKKLIAAAGIIDEVVVSVATSAIIFKEMTLPFLDRDDLSAVLPFEIEASLPFALEQAALDFMILKQDLTHKNSTILVAAVRKEDIQQQYDALEKAEITPKKMIIDVFAWYKLYQLIYQNQQLQMASETVESSSLLSKIGKSYQYLLQKIYPKAQEAAQNSMQVVLQNLQPQHSEIMVYIDLHCIKVLQIKNNMLASVRIIPVGVLESIERIGQRMSMIYHDVAVAMAQHELSVDMLQHVHTEYTMILEEINTTLKYFKQQEDQHYVQVQRVVMTGMLLDMPDAAVMAQNIFAVPVDIISVQTLLDKLSIISDQHEKITQRHLKLLSNIMFSEHEPENNILEAVIGHTHGNVVYIQLLTMLLTGVLAVGAVILRSNQELAKWQSAYNSSKKNCIQTIEQQMKIDLKNEKNLKNIIEKAQETLKSERQLWFAFTKQNETSVLEYLQDISMAVDRNSIGLDLTQMHLDVHKVTMSGTVKNFETLDLFEEELQSLKLLSLVQKPRQLSWNIQLQPKADQKGSSV